MPRKSFLKTPVGLLLLGAFLGELAIDPTDPIHFWLQRYILEHTFSKGMYTFLQIFDWYLLTASWYFLLLILAWILHIKKVSTIKIITIIGSIVGLGFVIGFFLRFLAS